LTTLKQNPSYDVVNEIYDQTPLITNACKYSDRDPATFLN